LQTRLVTFTEQLTAVGPSETGVVFKLDQLGNETVLHTFTGGADGGYPAGALLRDAAGNLYGTTLSGGNFGGLCPPLGCGVVFRLDPTGNEHVLHSFTGTDGAQPVGNMTQDDAGNFYGTASLGGAYDSCSYGCGAVFKVDLDGNETVLHSFSGADGEYPNGGLALDGEGNLYGTTGYGGARQDGVAFRLSSTGVETVLRSFYRQDGAIPIGGVIRDAEGSLYGATYAGGTGKFGSGVIFKLGFSGETVLFDFTGLNGSQPNGGLIADSTGNLFGTTGLGGPFGNGVVFELSPAGVETVLYAFRGTTDGTLPVVGLLSYKGYLYGTTQFTGSDFTGFGVIFRVTP
jgi:uncharacterized repeat protein (TIGR03803 family)